MDIGLFSEMVKDLILDNDEVTLPGVGTFVSEMVPSSFSDKGFTINPPYRRLAFRQREGSDDLLVNMYARANSTDQKSASSILKDFLSGISKDLCAHKTVVLPGLGRLRATKENVFFFIPDEDLDIFKYGFGLASVSLKTHEETAEEVSEAIAGLESILSEPLPEPAVTGMPDQVRHDEEDRHDEEAAAGMPDQVSHDDEVRHEDDGRSGGVMKRILIWTSSVIGAAAMFIGIFIILAKASPGFIDRLLYSPEELAIIEQYQSGRALKVIHAAPSAPAAPETIPQQSTDPS